MCLPSSLKTIALLLCCAGSTHADTLSVYFQSGTSKLDQDAVNVLDRAMYDNRLAFDRGVMLIGYADTVGADRANLQLSRQRAASVKAYLLRSGFPKARITVLEGLGEAGARSNARSGFSGDRRVDIVQTGITEKPVVKTNAEGNRPKRTAPSETMAAVRPQIHKVSLPETAPVVIDLSTMKVGEALVLGAIYFMAGHSRLSSQSLPTLNALYAAMLANPTRRIKLEGHICCTPESDPDGDDLDTHTQELSLNRAKSVRDFLIQKGIAAARIEVEGFGRRKPVVTEEFSEADAIRNRRVEVRILQ